MRRRSGSARKNLSTAAPTPQRSASTSSRGLTASDALWTDLPVLTQLGKTFAGRVVVFPISIAESEERIRTPRHRACDESGPRPAAVRAELAQNRLTPPVFDVPLYIGRLKQTHAAMLRRHQDRLRPDRIDPRR